MVFFRGLVFAQPDGNWKDSRAVGKKHTFFSGHYNLRSGVFYSAIFVITKGNL